MRTLLLGSIVVSATGCVVYKGGGTSGPVPGNGQVQITWQVGSAGCDASGVTDVEVDVDGSVDLFSCNDGGATVTASTGTHDITLRGLDVDGVPRFEGSAGAVTVYGGEVSAVPTVVLSALPATVDTTWYFEDGHLCSANGVQDVEADLFDENDALQATLTVPCDEGMLTLEAVEAGTYVLILFGRDPSGTVTYSGESQLSVERGDRIGVDVMLSGSL